jgi:hypothetical protein
MENDLKSGYQLQQSTNLTTLLWQTVPVRAAGPLRELQVSIPSNPDQPIDFYRLIKP